MSDTTHFRSVVGSHDGHTMTVEVVTYADTVVPSFNVHGDFSPTSEQVDQLVDALQRGQAAYTAARTHN